jgi:addiction module HigA family antidote
MTEPAELIRTAIERKDINQKEAAKLLEISEQYLSDLVNGKRSVSAFVAVRLQRQLGMNAQILLFQQATAELQKAWEEYGDKAGAGSGDEKEARANPAAVNRKPVISR